MRRLAFPTVLALVASLASCEVRPNGRPASGGPRLALTPCRLPGLDAPAQCGTLEVFEDRVAKTGRKIGLRVAVVRALAAAPDPDPVVVLAGGPGQSAVAVAGALLPVAERLRRTRDLVFVDQRGTGRSNGLPCELVPDGAPLSEAFKDTVDEAHVKGCLAKLDADPALYTTPIAMDDLDDVREALGYRELNLWGSSYGTRAALVYMRQHPEHVRTAILDGVAPLSLYLPLDIARDAQRALDRSFARCAADAACARAYPDLGARFEGLLAKMREAPLRVQVPHPRTGKPEAVEIPYDGFTSALRDLLYAPSTTALVPHVLARAMEGDLSPLVAASSAFQGGLDSSMSMGLFFSVVCTEDVPFVSDAAVDEDAKGTFCGPGPARAIARACQWWPRGRLPPGYREPVRSDKPVLLLSGELDPVTPPRWAEDAKKTLPNAVHVVVPGIGHNTTSVGCVRRLMAELVASGTTRGLDTSCADAVAPTPFFTSFAGPEP